MTEFQDMNDLAGWVEVHCDKSDAIRDPGEPDGGYGVVQPGSTFTNMQDSDLGPALIYTEWWRDGVPVLRDYRHPTTDETCKHYAREAVSS